MGWLLLVTTLTAGAADTCPRPRLIPAYAHNDYLNRRPLLDAIALGYRGAEVDVLRDGGLLLVAHDRRELRRSRTLAQLYLEPLRARKRACGHVLPDSTPFYLNIELKEADAAAFRLLSSQLRTFEELFLPADSADEPAVAVTLVGWWPLSGADSAWPSYLRVQVPVTGVSTAASASEASRVGLVSIDYEKYLRWDGRGPATQNALDVLARGRQLSGELGVPLRVHHAPARRPIAEWLLAGGVTLIGAGDLRRTRTLLVDLP